MFRLFHDVHFDLGHLANAGRLVVVKVALLDHAFVQGDPVAQDHGQPEPDRSLELRGDHIGVDGDAAVDRADDAVNLDLGRRSGDLGDHGYARVERVVVGEAAAPSVLRLTIPFGLFGGQLDYRDAARLLGQQVKAEGDWVFTGRARQFVEHGFHYVGRVVVTHGAVPEHGDG